MSKYHLFCWSFVVGRSSLVVAKAKTMIDIDQYQWKSRVLLIFAPGGDDQNYLDQQRLLEGREAELAERETLVMQLVDGPLQPPTQPLRERFGVHGDQFAVVLVGKDGTAKLVEHQPIAIARLSELIDSMPMRQEELNQGGESASLAPSQG